jgi:hypothetical protein
MPGAVGVGVGVGTVIGAAEGSEVGIVGLGVGFKALASYSRFRSSMLSRRCAREAS